jgi:hypothetical protein
MASYISSLSSRGDSHSLSTGEREKTLLAPNEKAAVRVETTCRIASLSRRNL